VHFVIDTKAASVASRRPRPTPDSGNHERIFGWDRRQRCGFRWASRGIRTRPWRSLPSHVQKMRLTPDGLESTKRTGGGICCVDELRGLERVIWVNAERILVPGAGLVRLWRFRGSVRFLIACLYSGRLTQSLPKNEPYGHAPRGDPGLGLEYLAPLLVGG